MSTDANLIDTLKPLEECEPSPEFVASIPRPEEPLKTSTKQTFIDYWERSLGHGEFALFLGLFAWQLVRGGWSLIGVLLGLLAAGMTARVITAVFRKGEAQWNPVVWFGIGVLGCILSWWMELLMSCLVFPSIVTLSNPAEWVRVIFLLRAGALFQTIVFAGGVVALAAFLSRGFLEKRPWVTGELHSGVGRKGWQALGGIVLCLMIASALGAPTHEQRSNPPEGRFYPLNSTFSTAVMRNDLQKLEILLNRYPRAWEWRDFSESVINEVHSLETAEYLVSRGANFASPQAKYETALTAAVEKGDDALVQFLLKHGADPNEGRRLPLISAIEKNNLYIVQVLLEAGADPNLSRHGSSAIDLAEKFVDKTILEQLRLSEI